MKQKQKNENIEGIYKLLEDYKNLLKKIAEIQVEVRKIRHKIDLLAKDNPVLGIFGWLVISLNNDYFEKINNFDFNKNEEIINNWLKTLKREEKES